MTAPNFSPMTDAQLAAEAARRMEWREIVQIRDVAPCDTGVICNGSPVRNDSGVIYRFDPAKDLNDTARFCAAFLAAFPGCHISVRVGATGSDCGAYNSEGFAVCMAYNLASEARARTVCILEAWNALGAAKV